MLTYKEIENIVACIRLHIFMSIEKRLISTN